MLGEENGICYHSLYKYFHILLYFKHVGDLNELWNIRHMLSRFPSYWDCKRQTRNLQAQGEKRDWGAILVLFF